MEPGRNAPCPCGSGKKYKACCLRAQRTRPVEDLWARLNRIDAELAKTLLSHAKRALVPEVLEDARVAFYGSEETREVPPRDLQMFIPWLIYSWVPPRELWRVRPDTGDRPSTVGGDYLSRYASRLDELSRLYLDASVREPFSLYEVVRVEPGEGFEAVDLFRDRPAHVSERSASDTLRPHDIIWAHLVSVSGLTTMSGAAPVALEPEAKVPLVDLVEKVRGRRRAITNDVLFSKAHVIRFVYLELMARRLSPPIPILQNTDGEPLALHELTFRIESAAAAFEALYSLNVVRSREELLEGAKRDRAGALESVAFDWNRLGNERMKSWSNTVLGHLRIEGRRLVAEVNSKERADRLRAEIEKRLGGGVVFERALVTSPERMLEEERRRPGAARRSKRERQREEEEALLLSNPEVREQLERMLDEHYETWVDEKLPILSGETPREAVKTKAGRAKVEAILAGWESRPETGLPGRRPPVARIREKLGL